MKRNSVNDLKHNAHLHKYLLNYVKCNVGHTICLLICLQSFIVINSTVFCSTSFLYSNHACTSNILKTL